MEFLETESQKVQIHKTRKKKKKTSTKQKQIHKKKVKLQKKTDPFFSIYLEVEETEEDW